MARGKSEFIRLRRIDTGSTEMERAGNTDKNVCGSLWSLAAEQTGGGEDGGGGGGPGAFAAAGGEEGFGFQIGSGFFPVGPIFREGVDFVLPTHGSVVHPGTAGFAVPAVADDFDAFLGDAAGGLDGNFDFAAGLGGPMELGPTDSLMEGIFAAQGASGPAGKEDGEVDDVDSGVGEKFGFNPVGSRHGDAEPAGDAVAEALAQFDEGGVEVAVHAGHDPCSGQVGDDRFGFGRGFGEGFFHEEGEVALGAGAGDGGGEGWGDAGEDGVGEVEGFLPGTQCGGPDL